MKKNSLFQYKWFLVGLLWVAYFLNQGDRQIFNTVIPLIKADLGLTDYDIGDVVMISQLSMEFWFRYPDFSEI